MPFIDDPDMDPQSAPARRAREARDARFGLYIGVTLTALLATVVVLGLTLWTFAGAAPAA